MLELSLREALHLGHNYIGTEHLLLGVLREGEGVAVQVLATLGADMVRLRQQVIALLGGQPSSEAAEAGGVSVEAGRDGPRCPACRSLLDVHVGYRVLAVIPVEQPETSEAIDVMFVYCLRCGVMLAHTSEPSPGQRPVVPDECARSAVRALATSGSAPRPRASGSLGSSGPPPHPSRNV